MGAVAVFVYSSVVVAQCGTIGQELLSFIEWRFKKETISLVSVNAQLGRTTEFKPSMRLYTN